ncbi:MAG: hypothetical protein ACFFDF_06245 [Candidatus Odinarchaeota archaeon]
MRKKNEALYYIILDVDFSFFNFIWYSEHTLYSGKLHECRLSGRLQLCEKGHSSKLLGIIGSKFLTLH